MNGASTDDDSSPWHRGGSELQRRVCVHKQMQVIGKRNIREYLPDQHREFFSTLPFIVLGAVDKDGEVGATLIAGKPGFISSRTDRRIHFEFTP